jgi:hypothetical protein
MIEMQTETIAEPETQRQVETVTSPFFIQTVNTPSSWTMAFV